jgi:glycine/D-amino acid oxidase-like deaminating enzyme
VPASAVRHPSYWETVLPTTFEPSSDLPRSTDVLIVGAGLMGHWLAYFLMKARPSLRVLVLERDLLGYGASTRNAGFLSCGTISEWLMDMRTIGEDAIAHSFAARKAGVEIVLRELAGCLRATYCGSADFDEITPEKDALAHALNDAVGEQVFSRRRVVFGAMDREVWFNAIGYGINSVQLLGCLHAALLERGVRFGYGAEVVALADGRAAVRLGDRDVDLSYDHGFLCTNAFAADLHGASRVRPGRGQVIVTEPCAVTENAPLGFLHNGYDYFRFVDGRLLVGGGRHLFREREATPLLETTGELRDYLRRLAAEILGVPDIGIDYHWAGIMGFPDGEHGDVGSLEAPTMIDPRTEVMAGCGGWGVSQIPYVASKRAEAW